VITVERLVKKFGTLEVLRGIDAHVAQGDKVVVIGPSGSGKSTFLRCINLLDQPTSGRILVDGEEITAPKCDIDRVRQKMGMVFQQFNLFPHLTVMQNITLAPIQLGRLAPAAAEDKAMSLLKRVGLVDKALVYPAKLSGGQKQRIAIARALALQPELLLFDEPTSALDPEITADILDLINGLRAEDRDLILVTHEIGFARHACDRVAFVREGKVEVEGPSGTIYDQSGSPEFARFVSRIIGWKV
jgi:polar amino acid transport system ATP-binding protein